MQTSFDLARNDGRAAQQVGDRGAGAIGNCSYATVVTDYRFVGPIAIAPRSVVSSGTQRRSSRDRSLRRMQATRSTPATAVR